MPPVSPPAKVLVTGASGFIAVWVVKTLLEKGYVVIGTVRSKSKGDYLTNLFKEFWDRFSYAIVEDIAKDGAFDEAVKGVDAVEHTASPFHFKADDPDELIKPAVHGTVGILNSIMKNNSNVKRVVVTASVACIVYDKGGLSTFTEEDWNNESPKVIQEKGRDAPPIHKYRASKTLAERAAWDFIEQNRGEIGFDLVTVNPPMVFGPIIHDVPSLSALNTSVAAFQAHTNQNSTKTNEDLIVPAGSWVDVRDVALIHALALEKEEAGGQRFIASSGPFTYQDVLDAIHASGPHENVPRGNPGAGKSVESNVFSATKAEKTLGIKFKTLEETAKATLDALKERGF